MDDSFNVRRYWAVAVLVLALGIGILIGALASRRLHVARMLPEASEARPLAVPSPVSLSNSFARIAARVTPAVVNINTESTIHFGGRDSRRPGGAPNGGLFNHFFGFGPNGIPHDMQQQSLGSGVILDKNGYVLTNYHVIMQDDGRPVDMIRVHLQSDDGNVHGYPAKVVGYDKWTDLAVIKINADRALPTAQLGDSDGARVGDWVLAIGSPFGLNASVTAGIISAKGREINNGLEDEFKRFLQTDAAINPGNSGGPLVSLAGQVIGINTAIATTRGAYDGVGFAIPSKIVRKVYNDIVSTGAVRRGAIGVTFMTLQTPALLHSFGAEHGVVVQSVESDGPAARAGLHLGDVITAVNSQTVRNGNELLAIVSNTPPGQRLRVDFVRKGERMSCTMAAADWNKIAEASEGPGDSGGPPPDNPVQPRNGALGLSVKDLAPDQVKQITAQLRRPAGVMVDDVDPGSFADDLSIQRFDVILSINRADVHSVADFKRLQSQLKSGQDVLLMIARRTQRGYSTLFLADQLP
jgi:serine protease Do